MSYSGPKHISWPTPHSFGVGLFTDFRLYWEALYVAQKKIFFTIEDLSNELPDRVKGLMYVGGFKRRTYQDLLRELLLYNFIVKVPNVSLYSITQEGAAFVNVSVVSPERAKSILLKKMQEVFVTPGWLINRLWELNPQGQGQIVIPTPIKEWKSKPRRWEDYAWNDELKNVSVETYNTINAILPNSFPLSLEEWIGNLEKEYERLGRLKPRRKDTEGIVQKLRYNPRGRLSRAMKSVSVEMLFSRRNPINQENDLSNSRSQLKHRSFVVWCPRLEEFGLIVYTDYKPEIPGRLIFPTCTFENRDHRDDYQKIESVTTPTHEHLYIHSPKWENINNLFIKVLRQTYDDYYNIQRIIYISLQDIRDEVCRRVRINTKLFDTFLKKTYEASIKGELNLSISLETDLREDMKVQVNRRGVYIDNTLYTLIAIKPL